jgi:hypothetical protein
MFFVFVLVCALLYYLLAATSKIGKKRREANRRRNAHELEKEAAAAAASEGHGGDRDDDDDGDSDDDEEIAPDEEQPTLDGDLNPLSRKELARRRESRVQVRIMRSKKSSGASASRHASQNGTHSTTALGALALLTTHTQVLAFLVSVCHFSQLQKVLLPPPTHTHTC